MNGNVYPDHPGTLLKYRSRCSGSAVASKKFPGHVDAAVLTLRYRCPIGKSTSCSLAFKGQTELFGASKQCTSVRYRALKGAPPPRDFNHQSPSASWWEPWVHPERHGGWGSGRDFKQQSWSAIWWENKAQQLS